VIGQQINHYEIVSAIGAGGMGSVYKGRDTRLDRFVAVKLLSGASRDELSRRRFIQEAKTASALNHPNIITVYEVSSHGDSDCIVMEYIEGRTLRTLAAAAPDIPALVRVFRQIAEALAVAHNAGIVHRDIKPENIMLRPDGYIKVLDFGIARLAKAPDGDETATSGLTRAGAIVGTPRYMSPEQITGDTVEAASDIFSLGIVMYELVAGKHPFSGGSTPAALGAILSETPVPPSRVNPELPAALDELIVRMLSKEPVLRPAAADIALQLGLLADPSGTVAAVRAVKPKSTSVGRDSEREELLGAFQTAAEGTWTLLCVAGEPGLGKTTLVEDFLASVAATNRTAWIARGHCSERLSGTDALLPWLESLESLIRGDGGDHAARLMRRFAPTWYLQVAPALGEATIEVLSTDLKSASPERVKRELHAFLEELCRVRPVILFFDDVHWSDVSTCELLGYVASKGQNLPMLVLSTYRPSTLVASKHAFLQLRLQLESKGCCRELPLCFLTRTDLERYAALMFGEHEFPLEFFDAIYAKTEGNPLFMSGMLRFLRDRRSVVQQDGKWILAQPPEEIVREIPASLRSMIQLKVDALPEADRHLLMAAAVQGVEFDSAVLSRVLSRDPIEVEERLQTIETTSDFVRLVAEQEMPDRTLSVRYRFVHVFYQNAMHASLTPSRRAALSRNIAHTLLAFHGDRVRALSGELALLFDTARDFPQAAKFYLQAARNAARVFAYPEAVLLANSGLRALQSVPDTPERAQLELPLSVTLGMSLMATTGYGAPEVIKTHIRSRDLCLKLNDRRRLFPVLWGLWSSYLIGGQHRHAVEIAQEMLAAAAGANDPVVMIEALHAMGSTLSYMGRLTEAREYLERIPALYDPDNHVFYATVYLLDPIVSALSMLARCQVLLGDIDMALERAEESERIAQKLAHPPSMAYATFFVSWVCFRRGEYVRARQAADAALKISVEHGLPQIREWSRIIRGAALCQQGDPSQGVADLTRSLAAQAAMHSRLERAYCVALLAQGIAMQGGFDEAMSRIGDALQLVAESEERAYEPEIHRLKAEILLAQAASDGMTDMASAAGAFSDSSAQLRAAEEALERCIELAVAASSRTLELRGLMTLLHLHQLQGDARDARQRLATCVAVFGNRESAIVREARILLSN
jgi:tetratricopeptide (TPR) repeat protein/predicted Ser/Thr protein kinase